MFFTLKSKDKEQTTWMQTRFKATSNKHKGRTVEITHQSHNSITIQHFSSAKASGSKSTIPKKHQKNANAKCQKNSNKITIAKKQQMQTAKKQKNSKQLIHWISNLWLVKNLIRVLENITCLQMSVSSINDISTTNVASCQGLFRANLAFCGRVVDFVSWGCSVGASKRLTLQQNVGIVSFELFCNWCTKHLIC